MLSVYDIAKINKGNFVILLYRKLNFPGPKAEDSSLELRP